MKAFDAYKKIFPNNAHPMKLDLPALNKLSISGKVSEGELTIAQYVSLMLFG
jgi:hypothetical protein